MPVDTGPGGAGQPLAPFRIVDGILSARARPPRWHLLVGALVALGAHAGLSAWVLRSGGPPLAPAPTPRLPIELTLDAFAPPPAPPPLPPPPEATSRARTAAPRTSPKEPPQPPPPAQAGAIVAAEPPASAPVDLTAEAFVIGSSRDYAGGVTAPHGTNHVAVQTRDLDPGAAPGASGPEANLSRPVSLEDESWSCAWPSEAEAAQIDEQTVVIRVVVDAEGTAESAEVISDPGHGFGQAATTCARRTRFTPARDAQGAPVRARSPLIKVRFTR